MDPCRVCVPGRPGHDLPPVSLGASVLCWWSEQTMPRVPGPLSSHCPGHHLFSCPVPGPHMARAVPSVHPSRLTSVFVQAGPARPLPAQLFVEPSPGRCLSSPAAPCVPSPQPVPGVCPLSIHLMRDDGFPKAGHWGRSRSTRILGPGPMPHPRRPLGASGAGAPHGAPGSRSCETASPAFLFLL